MYYDCSLLTKDKIIIVGKIGAMKGVWLDSWESSAIMLASKICLDAWVQLNDWLFASRVKLLSIFSGPPCMIVHTFLLFWALYYGVGIQYSIHPSTTRIKWNGLSLSNHHRLLDLTLWLGNLQTSSVIYFVINLCFTLNIERCFFKNFTRQLNKAYI